MINVRHMTSPKSQLRNRVPYHSENKAHSTNRSNKTNMTNDFHMKIYFDWIVCLLIKRRFFIIRTFEFF